MNFEYDDTKKVKKENHTGIPDNMKNQFERYSSMSFDDVRVHYNSALPSQLNALAYTQGTQVYIAPGQDKHLPHELGHVVQQKKGIVAATSRVNGVLVNDSVHMENQADEISKMAQGSYAGEKGALMGGRISNVAQCYAVATMTGELNGKSATVKGYSGNHSGTKRVFKEFEKFNAAFKKTVSPKILKHGNKKNTTKTNMEINGIDKNIVKDNIDLNKMYINGMYLLHIKEWKNNIENYKKNENLELRLINLNVEISKKKMEIEQIQKNMIINKIKYFSAQKRKTGFKYKQILNANFQKELRSPYHCAEPNALAAILLCFKEDIKRDEIKEICNLLNSIKINVKEVKKVEKKDNYIVIDNMKPCPVCKQWVKEDGTVNKDLIDKIKKGQTQDKPFPEYQQQAQGEKDNQNLKNNLKSRKNVKNKFVYIAKDTSA